MVQASGRSHVLRPGLLVGPILLLASFLAWWISDRLLYIGPFDRAQIGWAVVVPLAALSPGAAALAERHASIARMSRRIAAIVAVGLGTALIFGLAATVTQVGCQPVTNPLQVVPNTIPSAVLAGASYWVGYSVPARRVRQGHRFMALLIGAVIWLAIAAAAVMVLLVVSFPPLSCAGP